MVVESVWVVIRDGGRGDRAGPPPWPATPGVEAAELTGTPSGEYGGGTAAPPPVSERVKVRPQILGALPLPGILTKPASGLTE